MSNYCLPNDWHEVKLGSLGTFFRGRGGTRADEMANGLPCIRYGDLYTHHNFIVRTFCSAINPSRAHLYSSITTGDIIFAGSGETFEEIGKAAAYCGKERVYAGADTIIFRPSENLDSYFAGYAVNDCLAVKHKSRLGQGSSVIHISANHLASIPLRLPPIRQQQHIVNIFQTIDRTITHTEALIEKYQQIKAGLMHDLFTRGIGADGKLRPPRDQAPEMYRESSIGWIPKDWKLKACQDIFIIDSGITLGAHRRPKNNPRPYLRVANVFKERITLNDVAYLEASDVENIKYGLNIGDLLLVEGHANIQQIGRCGLVEGNAEKMLFQNHLFRLKAVAVFPHFGMYLLNSHVARKYWETSCSTSSGLNTINRKMLGKMSFGIPSSDEQLEIEKKLLSISEFIVNESSHLKKFLDKKSGLMHDLLTGKVQVNVDSAEAVND